MEEVTAEVVEITRELEVETEDVTELLPSLMKLKRSGNASMNGQSKCFLK